MVKTTFLQITEAAPILQSSGIPIKEGQPSGSRRFVVERKTDGERVGRGKRGKNRQHKGTETEGRAKPHQKGKKRYTKFKNSFMKTRSREE